MPRRVLVKTREMGQLALHLVRQEAGVWEPEWDDLRGTAIADLFTVVTREVIEQALQGYTKPLILALGLPPDGALRKLPPEAKICSQRRTCSLWDAQCCFPVAKKMPWCFQPSGLPPKASEAIQIWRERVYLVVALEEQKNA
jgi:hypothetical protein